jgi:DNA polymerase bacteriophage-type
VEQAIFKPSRARYQALAYQDGDGETYTHILHRDVETRCANFDLRDVGVHRYAADTGTEIWCMAYAVDDGPVQLWLPGDPVPAPFSEAAVDTRWLTAAHHDPFESGIEQYILGPRYGFPLVPTERHRCSLVMASALGLPAGLGKLAEALELANRKDIAGQRLMHQMTRPRQPRKGETADGVLYYDDDDRRRRLGEYCRQDVEVEREAFDVLRALVPTEHELWQLTAAINNRGFHVDRSFAEAARKIAQAATPEIDAELAELTGCAVTSINQVTRLQKWLQDQGCKCESLNRKVLEKLLTTELPPLVQRVVELRLGGAQAATKKINALLVRVATTTECAAAFSITEHRLADGQVRDFSRRT